MSPLSKKRGHHDLRILRFERTASTAAVRTHGDFWIIPSPYDVDGEQKTPVNITIKIDEQNSEYGYGKCEWELLHRWRSRIIKSMFAATS